ncbi:MAG: L,D-transpeptidase [Magnetococcales bacterium]|nr:L,D-transpeptidase [Magnetococcales bacterium]
MEDDLQIVKRAKGGFIHLFALIFLCFSHAVLASNPPAVDILKLSNADIKTAQHERLFIQGIQTIGQGHIAVALQQFATLTTEAPDFRLAQLIYGDLLLAQAHPLSGFGNGALANQRLNSLLEEARSRIRHWSAHNSANRIPASLLHLSHSQEKVVVVDVENARLYLFHNEEGVPDLVADYYVSSGRNGAEKRWAGDKKTPVGLYFVTDYLPGNSLPDFYGSGALPLNYPNEWDKRHRRTGSGIWLHGTPTNTYSRPPRASDGCVALTNLDFEFLEEQVGVGTPVIITENIEWLDPLEWKQRKEIFLDQFQSWSHDWLSHDLHRAIQHYSEGFHNHRHDFKEWQQVMPDMFNQWPAHTELPSDLSVIGYPGEKDLMVVTFSQSDVSNDLPRPVLRRQYWQMESVGAWKIVYEDQG